MNAVVLILGLKSLPLFHTKDESSRLDAVVLLNAEVLRRCGNWKNTKCVVLGIFAL